MISGPVMNICAMPSTMIDEVGDRRRVHRAAGARPGDQTDLRDDAAGLDVAPEDLRVAAEADDAFLDARAARVVDADHRRAGAHGEVHHLADLLGEHFAERPAQHGEVLREEEDLAPVDRGPAGDDAVAEKELLVEPERGGAVDREAVEFDERIRIDERVDAFAGGALAARVLAIDRLLPGRGERLLAHPLERLFAPARRQVVPRFRIQHRRGLRTGRRAPLGGLGPYAGTSRLALRAWRGRPAVRE